MNPYIVTPDLNGEGLHIGIVRARFNESIGLTELEACLKELEALGVDERDVQAAQAADRDVVAIALANSGPLQIELIQQHCDRPSIFREWTLDGARPAHPASAIIEHRAAMVA